MTGSPDKTLPLKINQDDFLNSFFAILDETFENHHGIFLDEDTSLFQAPLWVLLSAPLHF